MILLNILVIVIGIFLCVGILTMLGMYLRSEVQHYYYHQAPTIRTYYSHFQLMKSQLHFDPEKKLIDLWCWDGAVLRFLAQYAYMKHLSGVDNNRIAIWYGLLVNRAFGHHTINLTYGDIQEIDISAYDYIYLFLVPKHLDTLQDWLQNNMKSDAIVVSNTFQFSHREVSEELRDPKTWSVFWIYKKSTSKLAE